MAFLKSKIVYVSVTRYSATNFRCYRTCGLNKLSFVSQRTPHFAIYLFSAVLFPMHRCKLLAQGNLKDALNKNLLHHMTIKWNCLELYTSLASSSDFYCQEILQQTCVSKLLIEFCNFLVRTHLESFCHVLLNKINIWTNISE